MQFKLEDSVPHGAVIKVVGVGGGGGNAVVMVCRYDKRGHRRPLRYFAW